MELRKATIKIKGDEIVTDEALCKCGKYMDVEPVDGMPTLIRTEETLASTKNRNRINKDIENNKKHL